MYWWNKEARRECIGKKRKKRKRSERQDHSHAAGGRNRQRVQGSKEGAQNTDTRVNKGGLVKGNSGGHI